MSRTERATIPAEQAWEADCLDYDPFAGDFGSPGDQVLKDKMVTARKQGPCHECGATIQPNERIRTRTDVFDGELMSWRWCEPCCRAMAASWEDDGAAIEARHRLRPIGDAP